MRRTLFLFFLTFFLMLLTLEAKQYYLTVGLVCCAVMATKPRFRMLLILLALVLLTRYGLMQDRISNYNQMEHDKKVVHLKHQQKDYTIRFQGYKLLLKADTDVILSDGTYQMTYEPYDAMYENPNTFNYRKYLYSKGFVDVIKQSEVDLKLIELKQTSVLQKGYVFIENRIEHLFDEKEAGFIKGFLLGDKSGIDRTVYEDFQLNGTSHLLAISGLHIGLMLVMLSKLLPQWSYRTAMTLGLIGMYIMMIGMPYSAIRAIAMVLGALIAYRWQRPYDLLQTLGAVGILQLLINPFAIYHTGFIFSYAALMIIAVILGMLFNKQGHMWLWTPLILQLGMLPLVVYYQNSFHVLSFMANLVMIPLMTLLMYSAILSLVTGHPMLIYTCEKLIGLMISINTRFGEMTGFIRELPSPPLLWLVVFYGLLVLWSEKAYRKALTVLAITLVVGWLGYTTFAVEVYFLDVGQGDAILIKHRGYEIMNDTGRQTDQHLLRNILLKNGVNHIDAVLLSHEHADHAGGMLDIPDMLMKTPLYYRKPNAVVERMHKGIMLTEEISFGAITLEPVNYSNELKGNNASLVYYFNAYGRSLLMTGDIESSVEAKLTTLTPVDFIKVPHHGSDTSSTEEFLEQLQPAAAFICVGRNFYGHPNPEVVKRYQELGTDVYLTQEGCVKLTIFPLGIYFIRAY